MNRYPFLTLAALALASCAAEPPTVELIHASQEQCPSSTYLYGYVLLVDGEQSGTPVCVLNPASPAAAPSPAVLVGEWYCSIGFDDLFLSMDARVLFTADGYFLGTCSISEVTEGHTDTQSFDAEAGVCGVPSYVGGGPVFMTVVDGGVQLSGSGFSGMMDCEGGPFE